MGNTERFSFGLINWLKERKQKLQIVGQFSHCLTVTNITESCAVKHIHKLSEKMRCTEVRNFAGHNKLFRTAKTAAPCRELQNYLFT